METIRQAAEYISSKVRFKPVTGIVLGSGLSQVADAIEGAVNIPYKDIPHFPLPSVAGHAGSMTLGVLRGKPVAAMRGRVHLYEGHPMRSVVFPARVFAAMGVKTLILTNAAGGMQDGMKAGDLMLITDHINMLGVNPLFGPNIDEIGPRFPDMSEVYDSALREIALGCARSAGIELKQGVYAAMPGPSYETPAEVRMIKALGASAVGMSTVPEAVAARHAGLKVLGFSMISNLAAGISKTPLSHKELIETAAEAGKRLGKIIEAVAGLA